MASESKIEQRKQQAYARRKKNVKRAGRKLRPSAVKKLIAIIIIAVIAVCGCGAAYFTSGLARRLTTAVTIGSDKISAAEYSYYYNTSYTSYYQTMASYFGEQNVGIDQTKSLKDQTYTDGQTYAEYFNSDAISSLQYVTALASEAKKAGFEMTEETKERFNTQIESIESAAEKAGTPIAKYIQTLCGKGYTMEMYRNILERELLASDYRTEIENSLTYTEDDLEAYYAENKDTFDKASFRYVAFLQTEATEDTEAVTLEEAKAKAEAFMDGINNEVQFSNKATELAKETDENATDSSLRSGVTRSSVDSIDASLGAWVFDASRASGDLELIDKADGTGYYVAYMVTPAARDEYKTRDVRHILVLVNDTVTEEDAEAKAEEILKEWKDGDATEDSFAALANQYSEDTGSNTNGGLYTGVVPGQMVTAFDGWLFTDHAYGDTGIVETEYGFHVMYYVGESEQPKWMSDAESALRSADYNEWYDGIVENYPIKEHWLGKALRTEPLPA